MNTTSFIKLNHLPYNGYVLQSNYALEHMTKEEVDNMHNSFIYPIQAHVGTWTKESEVDKISNNGTSKPEGGIWTSAINSECGCNWIEFIVSTEIHEKETYTYSTYSINPEARILHIFCANTQGLPTVKSTVDIMISMLYGESICLDFEYLAQHFDAIHCDNGCIRGWDIDSTVWFNTEHLTLVSTATIKHDELRERQDRLNVEWYEEHQDELDY